MEELTIECKGCGRQVTDESVFCQYCGYSITGQLRPSQQQLQAKSGMSTGMIVAIVVVVVVVIPVVLAAVLYVMVLGISSPHFHTPLAMYQETTITNGVKMTITSISNSEISWSDVTVGLTTDGTESVGWSPRARDLDDGSLASVNLTSTGATALGDIDVYCWVTACGDGYVGGQDYIEVFTAAGATTFSSATTYALVLIHEPTVGLIGTGVTFTGQS